jgi:hypothetical protein
MVFAHTDGLKASLVASWPPFPRNADVRVVRVAGDLAFVGLDGAGISIVSLEDVKNPVVLGGVQTSLAVRDLALKDEWLFVAAGTNGVQVVNVQNAANPVLANTFADARDHDRIAIQGGLAVTAGTNGTTFLNVSDPAQPRLISFIPGQSVDVAFADPSTAVIAGYNKLQTIDLTDPSAPVVRSSVDAAGALRSIYVTNNILLAAEFGSSVEVYELWNATNLTKRGVFESFQPASVFVRDHYGYVTRDSQALDIIDLADLSAPKLVSRLGGDPGFTASGNSVLYQDYLLWAEGMRGLQVVKIANALARVLVTNLFGAWDVADSVAATNGFVFLADSSVRRLPRNEPLGTSEQIQTLS